MNLFTLLIKDIKIIGRTRNSLIYLGLTFLISFALFYSFLLISAQFSKEQMSSDQVEKIKIAFVDAPKQNNALWERMSLHQKIELTDTLTWNKVQESVEQNRIDIAIIFPDSFDLAMKNKSITGIQILYHRNSKGVQLSLDLLENYLERETNTRWKELGIDPDKARPFEIEERELSNMSEMINQLFRSLEWTLQWLLSLLFLCVGLQALYFVLVILVEEERKTGFWFWQMRGKNESKIILSKVMAGAGYLSLSMGLSLFGFLLALQMKQSGIFENALEMIRSIFSIAQIMGFLSIILLFALVCSVSGIFVALIQPKRYMSILIALVLVWVWATPKFLAPYLPFAQTPYLIGRIIQQKWEWVDSISLLLGMAYVLVLYASGVFWLRKRRA